MARSSNGTGGGDWSSAASWAASTKPVDDEDVTILAGDTIAFDEDMSGWTNGIRSLTITGSASTPGMLKMKHNAPDGSYMLKIKQGYTIKGSGAPSTNPNRGRILCNSDGVWGNTGSLPFAKKFIIHFKGTSATTGIAGDLLDVALYCEEPAVPYIEAYGTKRYAITGVSGVTLTANATHGFASNDLVAFRVTGGTLPAPLTTDDVYYVRNQSGANLEVSLYYSNTSITFTDSGSGTIEVINGILAGATGALNVMTDVSADAQWTASGATVIITNPWGQGNRPNPDHQISTINAISATTLTANWASIIAAKAPGARLWLCQRNVAVRIDAAGGATQVTYGNGPSLPASNVVSVFNCEFGNTNAPTAAAGIGMQFGQNLVFGGIITGLLYGFQYLKDSTISGYILGCTAAAMHVCCRVTLSGSIESSSSGINQGSECTLSGAVRGCTTPLNAFESLTVSGSVHGGGANFVNTFGGLTKFTKTSVVKQSAAAAFFTPFPSARSLVCEGFISAPVEFQGGASQPGTSQEVFVRGSATFRNAAGIISSLPNWPGGYFQNNYTIVLGGITEDHISYEAYGGTSGAHRTEWRYGTTLRQNSPTGGLRSGGATSVIEVLPLSSCGTMYGGIIPQLLSYIPVLKWTEADVPASTITRTIWIKGLGWSPNPLDTELWMEADYYDSAVDFDITTKHTYDSGIDIVLDGTNWTAYTLTMTTGRLGPVVYRVKLAKYYAGAKVYVDNMLVTS